MPPENGRALAKRPSKDAIAQLENVVIRGDLSTLSEADRIAYYARVCDSLGINPLTRPFEYLSLGGKLVLYARKDASDQLRSVKGISVDKVERERDDALGLAVVTVQGHDKTGRTDSAIGAVSIAGLKGEALANALMKAETKGKRRMTLSLAGLGWLDESEIDSVQPMADPITVQERAEKVASRAEALEKAAEPVKTPEVSDTVNAHVGAVVEQGAVLDVDDIPFEPAPTADEATAIWMRAIHAAGAERGFDHDRLHNWAEAAVGATSLNDLDPDQQARFLAAVKEPRECSHPQRLQRAVTAGVVCALCGQLLAVRGDIQQPGQGSAAAPDTTGPASQPDTDGASDGDSPAPAPAPAAASSPPGGGSPADGPAPRTSRAGRRTAPAARAQSQGAKPEVAPQEPEPVRSAPSAPAPLPRWFEEARVQYGFEPDALRVAVAQAFDGLLLDDLSVDDWDIFVAMAKDYAVLPPPATEAYRQLPVQRKSRVRAEWAKREADTARGEGAAALAAAAAGGTP